MSPFHFGESNDAGVANASYAFSLPRFVKRLYAWYLRHIRRDPLYAGLVEDWNEKTVAEYYALIARRETYRKKWFDWWNEEGLDFLITVPNALPAVPHGGMREGWKACGYTFLFNVVSQFCYVCIPPPQRTERRRNSWTTPQVYYPSPTSTGTLTSSRRPSNRPTRSKLGHTECTMRKRWTGCPWACRLWLRGWKRRS
jgi:hypothetical protein